MNTFDMAAFYRGNQLMQYNYVTTHWMHCAMISADTAGKFSRQRAFFTSSPIRGHIPSNQDLSPHKPLPGHGRSSAAAPIADFIDN
jgi:hypothetical protein